ncbi:DUF4384 domain-containing protein [Spirosoma endbachense]|uniref:DUF4384 domain-containing protein n=1 Tax=Spirosoma endbachense TaxID=2666025 RepID=A0A6P1VWS6_9BACT|nr:DUF4384 domain-containing protein [Spirosoma endbachense]QHV96149.1 hypothetical protein GJR95_14525 [Spirosoma endbachense]
MKPVLSAITALLMLAGFPVRAQSYTQSERVMIAENARRLVKDKYLANLEILTHYEANQPFEALQNHIRGLVRDAFRSREVLVYNEFRNPANAYTTIEEYVKDCRIFAGGKPVVNTMDFGKARYDIQQTKDGQPFINLYLSKQLQGTDKQGRPFQFQYLAEVRVMFVFDRQLSIYRDFRIAGISKTDKWPATAFTATAADTEQAASEQKDLLTVLASLANHLKENLPANAQQITLEMFTYKGCGVNNALSDRIFATFGSLLQKIPSIEVLSPAQHTERSLLVRGSYQEDLNNLLIVAELYNPHTNQVLKQLTNTDLPLAWLGQQNLKLKPDNYQQIVAIRDTIQQKISSERTTLSVAIRTDRGRTNVEYWEGSQLLVEAKANRPCHLRLVYLLADGTKTLLENDFEIKPGQENQYVRISPDVPFVCSAPFGMEYLLVYAAEDAFCSLPTKPNSELYVRTDNGYTIFVGSMLNMIEAVTCTKNRKEVAEDRIQITTRGLR